MVFKIAIFEINFQKTEKPPLKKLIHYMRNYTTREVSQARAARELMLNLAHASSVGTIDTLDSGVLNCAVTKTDIRNADAIFGTSIPSLKGKTVKRSSVPSTIVVAPRVTQVQQIMAVDVFFVKKLPFLPCWVRSRGRSHQSWPADLFSHLAFCLRTVLGGLFFH